MSAEELAMIQWVHKLLDRPSAKGGERRLKDHITDGHQATRVMSL